MNAMVIDGITAVPESTSPLTFTVLPDPEPGAGEVLVRVSTCGVCHTELDEIEGRVEPAMMPLVPGHQVVGTIEKTGPGGNSGRIGERVGVGWIHSSCGACERCRRGLENLCDGFRATGRDVDGGYAELMVVPDRFAIHIPDELDDLHAAPLLCAGAIGWRALHMSGIHAGARLGFTGFGASAHLTARFARMRFPDVAIYVFARSERQREFARELGAQWAGDFDQDVPEALDAVIDTTPAWLPVVKAMRSLAPGGRLVINAIRKTDVDRDQLATLDYERDLWMEKQMVSVANVTRADIEAALQCATEYGITPEVTEYALFDANRALVELARGSGRGAKVLRVASQG